MSSKVQVVEEAVESTAKTGLSPRMRVGFIIVAAVLTAGVSVLGVKLYKGIKAKRAAKESAPSDKPEETHE